MDGEINDVSPEITEDRLISFYFTPINDAQLAIVENGEIGVVYRMAATGNIRFHGHVGCRLIFTGNIPVKRVAEKRWNVFIPFGFRNFIHGVSATEYFRGVFGFQLPVQYIQFLGIDDYRPLVKTVHVRPARHAAGIPAMRNASNSSRLVNTHSEMVNGMFATEPVLVL